MFPLPDRPNLDQLRIRAKELKRAFEQGEQSAKTRVLEFHPKFAGRPPNRLEEWHLSLRDAQVTIARESGFQSWKALLDAIEGGATRRWRAGRSADISRRAFAEARKLRHRWCGTQHFLLALLNPSAPSPASEVLNELGLTYQDVSSQAMMMDRSQKRWTGSRSTPGYQLILGWAQGIAIGLDSNKFTDEHVLLAIVYGDLGGESQLVWFDIDPDDVVAGLRTRGIATPTQAPPVAPTPTGPWGPWVYFPKHEFQAVTQELTNRHPPGTVLWLTNGSKWKKGYWHIHGEDDIDMEGIVRAAVKDNAVVEVFSHQEALKLEKSGTRRETGRRPSGAT